MLRDYVYIPGEHITPPGNMLIGDNFIEDSVPAFHMFCLAEGPLELVASEFCRAHPMRKGAHVYDACVELTDINRFGEALRTQAILSDFQETATDVPFGIAFPFCRFQPVQYAQTTVSFSTKAPDPSPFLKRDELKWQREHRFVFRPQFCDTPPSLIVKVPGLRSMIKQVTM